MAVICLIMPVNLCYQTFFKTIESKHIGKPYVHSKQIDNSKLIKINEIIRSHPVEVIGKKLRTSMTSMKKIV
jgi:ketol-acid reductoisomerase